MTEEEYWRGDPNLVVAYRELNKMKMESRNHDMWLQGMYIHEGFAVALQNGFSKKGSKKAKYPQKPYEIFPKTETDKKASAKEEREKAIRSLNAWKSAWDKRNGK